MDLKKYPLDQDMGEQDWYGRAEKIAEALAGLSAHNAQRLLHWFADTVIYALARMPDAN